VLVAALLLGCVTAWADEFEEASKLLKAGQHPQALEQVNKALAANPRDPQAQFLKGLILTDQGNNKEAAEVFVKLTREHPELPEPYNNLAVIYASQGQYDKARAALEQSIRTHPSYATAYENLSDVYAKLASQAYGKALQIDATNAAAQNKLALVRELGTGTSRPIRVATAERPAAARPAPSVPASAAQQAPGDILQTVAAWARAWSSKDVETYLAFYAPDFKTPAGEARGEWEKARRQRITAPKSIAVSVEGPKVRLEDNARASVTFRQSYRSEITKATSTKTLVLVKADGRWRIQQEKVGK